MKNILSEIKHFIKNDRSPESQIKWSLYLRVWKEFGMPYLKWLLLGVVCTVIAAGAEGFAITLIKDVIDQGFIEKNMNSLYLVGVELVAAYCFKSVFTYSKTVSMSKAGLLGATGLRQRLFAKMLTLGQDFFQKERTGPIVNRFTGLADAVLGLVTDSVITVVQNIATMIIMLSLMFWYAPQITAILMFLAPVIIVTVVVLTRKRRIIVRKSFGFTAESISLINESILGVKTIQAFTAERHSRERMRENEEKRVRMSMKAARINGLQSPVLEIFISIGLCGALLVGGHFIIGGSLTTGDFTAFLLALSAAYRPTKVLSNVSNGIQAGLIAAEGLFNMLDREPTVRDREGAVAVPTGPLGVSFESINFFYEKHAGDVIHDFSLRVKPGRICALVGRSGGGKSTIFNLLQRFYDTQRGAVKVGGIDVRDLKHEDLRRHIAVVSQDEIGRAHV